MNRLPIVIGVSVSLALIAYLSQTYGWRQGALFVVGFGAGLVLYHAAFGFTSAWRNIVHNGDGAGLRAQLIMLAVTALFFLPLIADGQRRRLRWYDDRAVADEVLMMVVRPRSAQRCRARCTYRRPCCTGGNLGTRPGRSRCPSSRSRVGRA